MKLFLAFLIALMQVTPTLAAQRILSADKIEGIVTQKDFVGSKGHFEKNAAGVVAYADAGATSPVDGTGGSPNTTCTRSATSPISGDGSLLITKTSGSSRQGEGCGMAFSTDTNHYGRVLTISADYIVSSGTFTAGSSSTDSDITVWLYDVTNAVLIQPSNYKFFSSSTTLSDKFIGQFQTASNSTSYRLIFHIGTTDTDALVLKLDNISVSPQGTTLAPVITDYKAYTPTTTNLTLGNGTQSAMYRRVGDMLEVRYSLRFGSTTSLSGSLVVDIPSGLSIDTTKRLATDFGGDASGWAVDVSTSNRHLITARTNTSTGVSFQSDAVTGEVGTSIPFTWATSDYFDIVFKVPILGWSSGLEIGDNYSGREIVARGYFTGQTGYASGSYITADIGGVTFDTTSMASVGSDTVTVPSAGKYEIYSSMSWANNSSGQRLISYSVNAGTEVVLGKNDNPSGTNNAFANGSNVVNLNAGDVVRFRFQSSSVSPDTNPDGISSWYVKKLASPAAIASGEKVAARYYSSQSTSFSSATNYALDFPTKDFDTHGSWTTTGGHNSTLSGGSKFTCPVSGIYRVSAFVVLGYTGADFNGTTEYIQLSVYKNGAIASAIESARTPTNQQYPSLGGSTYVQCNAGDYLQITFYQDSGASQSMFVNNENQWVVFEKL